MREKKEENPKIVQGKVAYLSEKTCTQYEFKGREFEVNEYLERCSNEHAGDIELNKCERDYSFICVNNFWARIGDHNGNDIYRDKRVQWTNDEEVLTADCEEIN